MKRKIDDILTAAALSAGTIVCCIYNEQLAGRIVLFFTLAVIALLIILALNNHIEDIRKESRQEARQVGRALARFYYRRMLKSARFRIHHEMRIVNESDIDWGGGQRVDRH